MDETPTSDTAKIFIKYFVFAFAFIISFILMNTTTVEMLGLNLFLIVNMLFFIIIGKELFDGTIDSSGKTTEWLLRYGTLFIAMIFSFVSSIMMMLTIFSLQSKFTQIQSEIEWSKTDRKNLYDTETIFITVTTFIGVAMLYVYKTPDDIRKFTLNFFDQILNGDAGNWIRVIFPVVILGVGSALYGRLQMSSIEVNKTPKRLVCEPATDNNIKPFKDSFIKTFWFLFAFVIVVLARPFVEANFNLFGISPSMPFGFSSADRSLIFGQNPSISLLSLLTLGLSNLTGINKRMHREMKKMQETDTNEPQISGIKGGFAALVVIMIALLVVYSNYAVSIVIGILVIAVIGMVGSFFIPKEGFGKSLSIAMKSILLMPVLRWDILYLMAKYAFGLTGLVYAGFTIRDFQEFQSNHGNDACLYSRTHIRQLYIAFIVFLIVFYAFNTLSASNLTAILTGVMRYLVPPTLLGLSSYLVFLTNSFVQLAPKLIIQ